MLFQQTARTNNLWNETIFVYDSVFGSEVVNVMFIPIVKKMIQVSCEKDHAKYFQSTLICG